MDIISGRVKKPFTVILYGTPGIGKSTWAASAPDPLFIGAEENDELVAKRLKRPETWAEFVAQVKWLSSEKPEYKTIVIDTLDSVEKLLHRQILAEDPKASGSMARAHGGYGKAYEQAETELIKFRSALQGIREQDKNIIILAHSNKTQATDTILGMMYDTYEMSIHKKAQAVFVDWVSCVLFGTYITHKADDANSDKVFAIGQGERVVLTEKRPGFLAKNRYHLPYEMPLEFDEFYQRYLNFFKSDSPSPVQIYESCSGLAENISDPDIKAKVLESLFDNRANPKMLLKIQNRIQQLVGA